MERDVFLNLPAEEVTKIVRAGGSRVCVFPFNGTRRWFLLEHGRDFDTDAARNYVELTTQGYINTYKKVFDHGIDTIVAPVFGGEILNRGDEYMREIGASMDLLATHPAFIDFYDTYDIRVHFYGDYRRKRSGLLGKGAMDSEGYFTVPGQTRQRIQLQSYQLNIFKKQGKFHLVAS